MNGDLNEVHTYAGMIRASYLLQHPKIMNIIPNWYQIYTSFFTVCNTLNGPQQFYGTKVNSKEFAIRILNGIVSNITRADAVRIGMANALELTLVL